MSATVPEPDDDENSILEAVTEPVFEAPASSRPSCRMHRSLPQAKDLERFQSLLWRRLQDDIIAADASDSGPQVLAERLQNLRDATEDHFQSLISLLNLSESARLSAEHRAAKYAMELGRLKRILARIQSAGGNNNAISDVVVPKSKFWLLRFLCQRERFLMMLCFRTWERMDYEAKHDKESSSAAMKWALEVQLLILESSKGLQLKGKVLRVWSLILTSKRVCVIIARARAHNYRRQLFLRWKCASALCALPHHPTSSVARFSGPCNRFADVDDLLHVYIRKLALRTFVRWHGLVLRKQELSNLVFQRRRKALVASMATSCTQWRKAVEREQRNGLRVLRFRQTYCRLKLVECLNRWQSVRVVEKRRSALLSLCWSRQTRSRSKAAWRLWVEAHRHRRTRERTECSIRNRHRRFFLLSVMKVWGEVADLCKSRKQIISQRVEWSVVHRTLDAWVSVTRSQHCLRSMKDRRQRRTDALRLVHALRIWSVLLVERRAARRMKASCTRKRDCDAITNYFSKWVTQADVVRRLRRISTRVSGRWQSACVKGVFECWMASISSQVKHEESEIIERQMQRLSQYLKHWVFMIRRHKMLLRMETTLHHRWRVRSQARMLSEWKIALLQQRCSSVALARADLRCRRARIRKAVHAWRVWMCRYRKCARILEFCKLRLYSTIWDRWNAWIKSREDSLATWFERKRKSTLAATFGNLLEVLADERLDEGSAQSTAILSGHAVAVALHMNRPIDHVRHSQTETLSIASTSLFHAQLTDLIATALCISQECVKVLFTLCSGAPASSEGDSQEEVAEVLLCANPVGTADSDKLSSDAMALELVAQAKDQDSRLRASGTCFGRTVVWAEIHGRVPSPFCRSLDEFARLMRQREEMHHEQLKLGPSHMLVDALFMPEAVQTALGNIVFSRPEIEILLAATAHMQRQLDSFVPRTHARRTAVAMADGILDLEARAYDTKVQDDAWNAWRCLCRQAKNRYNISNYRLAVILHQHLRSVLNCWIEFRHRRFLSRHRVMAVLQLQSEAKKRKSFLIWNRLTLEKSRKAAIIARKSHEVRRRALADVVRTWSCLFKQNKTTRAYAHKRYRQVQQHSMRQWILSWSAAAHGCQDDELVVLSFRAAKSTESNSVLARRCQRILMGIYCKGWLSFVERCRDTANRAKFISSRRCQARLQETWAALSAIVIHNIQSRRLLQELKLAYLRRLARMILVSWHDRIEEARYWLNAATTHLSSMKKTTVLNALLSWQGIFRSQRNARVFASFRLMQRQAKLLRAWCGEIFIERQKVINFKRLRILQARRCLSRAFEAWSGSIRSSKIRQHLIAVFSRRLALPRAPAHLLSAWRLAVAQSRVRVWCARSFAVQLDKAQWKLVRNSLRLWVLVSKCTAARNQALSDWLQTCKRRKILLEAMAAMEASVHKAKRRRRQNRWLSNLNCYFCLSTVFNDLVTAVNGQRMLKIRMQMKEMQEAEKGIDGLVNLVQDVAEQCLHISETVLISCAAEQGKAAVSEQLVQVLTVRLYEQGDKMQRLEAFWSRDLASWRQVNLRLSNEVALCEDIFGKIYIAMQKLEECIVCSVQNQSKNGGVPSVFWELQDLQGGAVQARNHEVLSEETTLSRTEAILNDTALNDTARELETHVRPLETVMPQLGNAIQLLKSHDIWKQTELVGVIERLESAAKAVECRLEDEQRQRAELEIQTQDMETIMCATIDTFELRLEAVESSLTQVLVQHKQLFSHQEWTAASIAELQSQLLDSNGIVTRTEQYLSTLQTRLEGLRSIDMLSLSHICSLIQSADQAEACLQQVGKSVAYLGERVQEQDAQCRRQHDDLNRVICANEAAEIELEQARRLLAAERRLRIECEARLLDTEHCASICVENFEATVEALCTATHRLLQHTVSLTAKNAISVDLAESLRVRLEQEHLHMVQLQRLWTLDLFKVQVAETELSGRSQHALLLTEQTERTMALAVHINSEQARRLASADAMQKRYIDTAMEQLEHLECAMIGLQEEALERRELHRRENLVLKGCHEMVSLYDKNAASLGIMCQAVFSDLLRHQTLEITCKQAFGQLHSHTIAAKSQIEQLHANCTVIKAQFQSICEDIDQTTTSLVSSVADLEQYLSLLGVAVRSRASDLGLHPILQQGLEAYEDKLAGCGTCNEGTVELLEAVLASLGELPCDNQPLLQVESNDSRSIGMHSSFAAREEDETVCLERDVYSRLQSGKSSVVVQVHFDLDWNSCFQSVENLRSFNARVEKDVASALRLPPNTVAVLCHHRGSVVTHLAIGLPPYSPIFMGGAVPVSSMEVAQALVDYVNEVAAARRDGLATSDSTLGRFARDAAVQGIVPEVLCTSMMAANEAVIGLADRWRNWLEWAKRIVFTKQKCRLQRLFVRSFRCWKVLSRSAMKVRRETLLKVKLADRARTIRYLAWTGWRIISARQRKLTAFAQLILNRLQRLKTGQAFTALREWHAMRCDLVARGKASRYTAVLRAWDQVVRSKVYRQMASDELRGWKDRGTVVEMWHRWCKTQRLRRNVYKIFVYRRVRVLNRFLRAWIAKIIYLQNLVRKMRAHLARKSRKIRQIWTGWCDVVAWKRQMRQVAKRAEVKRGRNLAILCMCKWEEKSAYRRKIMKFRARMCETSRVDILKQKMLRWFQWLHRQSWLAWAHASVQDSCLRHLKIKVFVEWAGQCRRHRLFVHKSTSAANRYAHSLNRNLLSIWRDYAKRRRLLRVAHVCVGTRIRTDRLRKAWAGWRRGGLQLRVLEYLSESVSETARLRRLASSVRVWHSYSHREQSTRTAGQSLYARKKRRILSAAWSALLCHRDMRREQPLRRVVLARWFRDDAAIVLAWVSWAHATAHARRRVAAAQRLALKALRRLLLRSMSQWTVRVAQRHEDTAVLLRIVRRTRAHCLTRAWKVWVMKLRRRAAVAELSRQARVRMTDGVMYGALLLLRTAARRRHALNAAACAVIVRVYSSAKRHAWKAWRTAFQPVYQTASEPVVVRVLHRMLISRRLRAAMVDWHYALHRRSRLMKTAARTLSWRRSAALRLSLGGWVDVAAAMRARRITRCKAVRRWPRRVCSWALRVWQLSMSEVGTPAMEWMTPTSAEDALNFDLRVELPSTPVKVDDDSGEKMAIYPADSGDVDECYLSASLDSKTGDMAAPAQTHIFESRNSTPQNLREHETPGDGQLLPSHSGFSRTCDTSRYVAALMRAWWRAVAKRTVLEWSGAAVLRRRLLGAMRRVMGRRQKTSLARCLLQWGLRALHLQRAQRVAGALVCRVAFRVVLRNFIVWRNGAQKQTILRNIAEITAARRRRDRRHNCFHKWIRVADGERVLRCQWMAAVAFVTRRKLAKCVSSLRRYVSLRADLRRTCVRIAAAALLQRLQSTFWCWRSVVAGFKRSAKTLNKFLWRRAQRLTKCAWQGWCTQVDLTTSSRSERVTISRPAENAARISGLIALLQRYQLRSSVAVMMSEWACLLKRQKQFMQVLSRSRKRQCMRSMTATYALWHAHLRRRRQMALAWRVVAWRRRARVIFTGWWRWCKEVALQQAFKHAKQPSVPSSSMVAGRHGMEYRPTRLCWALCGLCGTSTRTVATPIVFMEARRRRRRLGQCLVAWCRRVWSCRHCRQVALIVTKQRRLRLLHLMFCTWFFRCTFCLYMRRGQKTISARMHRRLTARALVWWQQRSARRRRLGAVTEAVMGLTKRTRMKRAWCIWCAAVWAWRIRWRCGEVLGRQHKILSLRPSTTIAGAALMRLWLNARTRRAALHAATMRLCDRTVRAWLRVMRRRRGRAVFEHFRRENLFGAAFSAWHTATAFNPSLEDASTPKRFMSDTIALQAGRHASDCAQTSGGAGSTSAKRTESLRQWTALIRGPMATGGRANAAVRMHHHSPISGPYASAHAVTPYNDNDSAKTGLKGTDEENAGMSSETGSGSGAFPLLFRNAFRISTRVVLERWRQTCVQKQAGRLIQAIQTDVEHLDSIISASAVAVAALSDFSADAERRHGQHVAVLIASAAAESSRLAARCLLLSQASASNLSADSDIISLEHRRLEAWTSPQTSEAADGIPSGGDGEQPATRVTLTGELQLLQETLWQWREVVGVGQESWRWVRTAVKYRMLQIRLNWLAAFRRFRLSRSSPGDAHDVSSARLSHRRSASVAGAAWIEASPIPLATETPAMETGVTVLTLADTPRRQLFPSALAGRQEHGPASAVTEPHQPCSVDVTPEPAPGPQRSGHTLILNHAEINTTGPGPANMSSRLMEVPSPVVTVKADATPIVHLKSSPAVTKEDVEILADVVPEEGDTAEGDVSRARKMEVSTLFAMSDRVRLQQLQTRAAAMIVSLRAQRRIASLLAAWRLRASVARVAAILKHPVARVRRESSGTRRCWLEDSNGGSEDASDAAGGRALNAAAGGGLLLSEYVGRSVRRRLERFGHEFMAAWVKFRLRLRALRAWRGRALFTIRLRAAGQACQQRMLMSLCRRIILAWPSNQAYTPEASIGAEEDVVHAAVPATSHRRPPEVGRSASFPSRTPPALPVVDRIRSSRRLRTRRGGWRSASGSPAQLSIVSPLGNRYFQSPILRAVTGKKCLQEGYEPDFDSDSEESMPGPGGTAHLTLVNVRDGARHSEAGIGRAQGTSNNTKLPIHFSRRFE